MTDESANASHSSKTAAAAAAAAAASAASVAGTNASANASSASATTTATSESENNNNNNNDHRRGHQDEPGKILAVDSAAAAAAARVSGAEGAQGPQASGASVKIERAPSERQAASGELKPAGGESASDGNNNRATAGGGGGGESAGGPHERAAQAERAGQAAAGQAAGQALKGAEELGAPAAMIGVKVEPGAGQLELAGDEQISPEYTMLKPAVPGEAPGQPQQQQQQQHSATMILTDLDAASQQLQRAAEGAGGQATVAATATTTTTSTTNLQDGSQLQGGAGEPAGPHGSIKIEQQQQRQQHELEQAPPSQAPLIELAPASTTLSELTSVNPVTIQHHPQFVAQPQQQQQAHLQQQHHQQHIQQQQQHLGEPTHLGGEHLQQPGDMQHLHHQAHHLGGGVYAPVVGQQFQLAAGAGGHLQHATDGASQSAFEQLQGGQEGVAQPQVSAPRAFHTTGPPSASSLASSGGMTTPTSAPGGPGSTAGASATGGGVGGVGGGGGGGGSKRRSWSQMNRNANKTEIAKVYSQFGFRCFLEAPISTCRRKEEDRITYINKGEFYGLTLDYVPDPTRPLRSSIVKAVVMLVFREDKSPEEDLKSWQFWHSRQHSAKQRILDVDNKNHVNVINQIEEVSLNAIAFYWNPFETRQAKLNIAIQCLSTDFSNQKGVKGLPLNLQVDIYDLFTETSTPVYRAYSTLLSYCDKGAQRRSRDEERRALKRKLADQSSGASSNASTTSTTSSAPAGTTATTTTTTSAAATTTTTTAAAAAAAKKFEDLYHKPCDRTEFYAMADLIRAPTLYSPTEAEALGLAAAGAISDTNSNAGGPGTPSIKQPMSQASGVSITPLAATTPIPPHQQPQQQQQLQPDQQQQQQQQQSATTGLPYSQPGPAQQVAGPRAALPLGAAGQSAAQFVNLTGAPMAYGSAGATLVTAGGEYLSAAGTTPTGQMLAAPQQASSMQQQQHQMLGQPATVQHHHQHHQHQPHQQQQQQQQQHHHYHQMNSNSLAPTSYGVIQADPNQQQQQQQYAVLQPSIGMATVQHTPSGPSHLHAHSHQHAHQAQQMMAQANQQHAGVMNPMDPSRGQMHQGSMMMSGGNMMQQQPQQQQQQQQHQMHGQYMAAGQQPANNLANLTAANTTMGQQQQPQQQQQPFAKRPKLYPGERVLIYAKQADEKDFYPLHLAPPSLSGLVYAIEQKYKIDSTKVANIYKKSKKGIRVQMDDEMIRHYCNEDMVQLEVIQTSDSRLEITLVEL